MPPGKKDSNSMQPTRADTDVWPEGISGKICAATEATGGQKKSARPSGGQRGRETTHTFQVRRRQKLELDVPVQ